MMVAWMDPYSDGLPSYTFRTGSCEAEVDQHCDTTRHISESLMNGPARGNKSALRAQYRHRSPKILLLLRSDALETSSKGNKKALPFMNPSLSAKGEGYQMEHFEEHYGSFHEFIGRRGQADGRYPPETPHLPQIPSPATPQTKPI